MTGQSGIAAFGLCVDRIEVHKPRFEQRPSDRLQRFAHPAVQFDLVVQCTEDMGDGALFTHWGKQNWERSQIRNIRLRNTSRFRVSDDLLNAGGR